MSKIHSLEKMTTHESRQHQFFFHIQTHGKLLKSSQSRGLPGNHRRDKYVTQNHNKTNVTHHVVPHA